MFNRTHTYTVHTKSSDEVLLVREGFSLFAFLFGPFWAVYHRLWLFAAAIIGVMVIQAALWQGGFISEESFNVMQLITSFYIGCVGNDARRAGLKHRGFVMKGVVIADNETRATQRFLDHSLA